MLKVRCAFPPIPYSLPHRTAPSPIHLRQITTTTPIRTHSLTPPPPRPLLNPAIHPPHFQIPISIPIPPRPHNSRLSSNLLALHPRQNRLRNVQARHDSPHARPRQRHPAPTTHPQGHGHNQHLARRSDHIRRNRTERAGASGGDG